MEDNHFIILCCFLHDSTGVHMLPPPGAFPLPPPHPTAPGCKELPASSSKPHWLPVLHAVMHMLQHCSLNPSPSLTPLLRPHPLVPMSARQLCVCISIATRQMGFPGGSGGEASASSAGDPGLIPGSGRSPGEGNGDPLQYSCLENPMDGGAWWATVHGVAKR